MTGRIPSPRRRQRRPSPPHRRWLRRIATQPLVLRWSAADSSGQAVNVPDAARPTVLLIVRADQAQSRQAIGMLAAAALDAARTQIIVVVNGPQAREQAQGLMDGTGVSWPVVADVTGSLSRQLGVGVWPATVVVRSDAVVVAHVAGAPASLPVDVAAQVQFASGAIDRAGLNQRLASRTLVGDDLAKRVGWYVELAQKHLAEGKPDQARAMCLEGLKLQADSLPLQVALIEATLDLKQASEASALLAKLPKTGLPGWQTKLLQGKAMVLAGRWPQAKSLLAGALKEKGDLPEAHFLLGRVYEQEKDWEKAAKEFREAHGQ